jgi:hypothetical protein
MAEGQEAAGEDGEEVALPLLLEMHLAAAGDGLPLETLQALATRQLSAAEAGDRSLDVLSGFHLTDGEMRFIGLEGPVDGAMSGLIKEVCLLACRAQECLALLIHMLWPQVPNPFLSFTCIFCQLWCIS